MRGTLQTDATSRDWSPSVPQSNRRGLPCPPQCGGAGWGRLHFRRVRTAWRPSRSKSGGLLNHIVGVGHGSNPHRTTSSGVSIRPPVLTVGLRPPPLLEPLPQLAPSHGPAAYVLEQSATLRTSTLDEACLLSSLVLNDAYGDPRSGTGTWSGGARSSAAALLAHPSQVPRIQMTARRIRAASRRARSPTLPVERKHRESPPGRQSQPRGVRAHGAPLEAGNRCGAGTRWIADHSTADRRSPNLACKMRQRHAARVQTAQRRDPQRPHGRDSEDTLAQLHPWARTSPPTLTTFT